jgi:hypothetical protein
MNSFDNEVNKDDQLYFSFEWFPGVWSLCAYVSEHTVCSIFIGGADTTYEDGAECSETSSHKSQAPGNHPK